MRPSELSDPACCSKVVDRPMRSFALLSASRRSKSLAEALRRVAVFGSCPGTGLPLYVDPQASDLHAALNTVAQPVNQLDEAALCPGALALAKINASLR